MLFLLSIVAKNHVWSSHHAAHALYTLAVKCIKTVHYSSHKSLGRRCDLLVVVVCDHEGTRVDLAKRLEADRDNNKESSTADREVGS